VLEVRSDGLVTSACPYPILDMIPCPGLNEHIKNTIYIYIYIYIYKFFYKILKKSR